MSDVELERTKIEFPCPDYPIKVLGNAEEDLLEHVVNVMNKHSESFDESRIRQNQSSKGKFISYSATVSRID